MCSIFFKVGQLHSSISLNETCFAHLPLCYTSKTTEINNSKSNQRLQPCCCPTTTTTACMSIKALQPCCCSPTTTTLHEFHNLDPWVQRSFTTKRYTSQGNQPSAQHPFMKPRYKVQKIFRIQN